jgi:hypothetical protein
MRPRAVVFVGPSLAPELAAALVDGRPVELRPPARRGDLLALLAAPPAIVGLIDGLFGGAPSVLHKEILLLLDAGVQVLGASSMGALRAAELDRYGMIGIGHIYRLYRSGRLSGDDEVALLHAPADLGFQPLTVPLVDLRLNLRQATRSGQVPERSARNLVRAVRNMPLEARTTANILVRAAQHMPRPVAGRFRRLVEQSWHKYKAEDARSLIERVTHQLDHAVVRPRLLRRACPLTRYIFSHQRIHCRPYGSGVRLCDADILNFEKLMAPSIERTVETVIVRALCAEAARREGILGADRDDLVRQFWGSRGLEDEEAQSWWLAARQLSRSELQRYLADCDLALRFADQVGTPHQPTFANPSALTAAETIVGVSAQKLASLLIAQPGLVDDRLLLIELKLQEHFPSIADRAARLAADGMRALETVCGLSEALHARHLQAWFARRHGIDEGAVADSLQRRAFVDLLEFTRVARLARAAELVSKQPFGSARHIRALLAQTANG